MLTPRTLSLVALSAALLTTSTARADFGYALSSLTLNDLVFAPTGGTGTVTNLVEQPPYIGNYAFLDGQKVSNLVAGYAAPQAFVGDPPAPPPQSFQVLGERPGTSYAYADQFIQHASPANGYPDFSTFRLITETYVESPRSQADANQPGGPGAPIYGSTFSVVGGPVTFQWSGSFQSAAKVAYDGPVPLPLSVRAEESVDIYMTIYNSSNNLIDSYSPPGSSQAFNLTGAGSEEFANAGSFAHTVTLSPGDYDFFFFGSTSAGGDLSIPVPEPSAFLLFGLGAGVLMFGLRRVALVACPPASPGSDRTGGQATRLSRAGESEL